MRSKFRAHDSFSTVVVGIYGLEGQLMETAPAETIQIRRFLE